MKKSVVLTGASGGIGSAIAEKLAGEGYEVFGLDMQEPERSTKMKFIKTDLTDPGSVESAFRQISADTDQLCGIIHAAGIYDLNSLVEISEEDLYRIFNVNLFAAYRVNKTFLPLLAKGGRIVMISSELAPLDPLPFTGIYAITKTAIEKYAYSLRMELQLLGYRVSVIRPGAVDTNMLGVSNDRLNAFCEGTKLYSVNAARFKNIVERVEITRTDPAKVAEKIIKALSSSRPRYIYKINRNPWLLVLSSLPDRLQTGLIGRIMR